jgi:hypothetical protein
MPQALKKKEESPKKPPQEEGGAMGLVSQRPATLDGLG